LIWDLPISCNLDRIVVKSWFFTLVSSVCHDHWPVSQSGFCKDTSICRFSDVMNASFIWLWV
jgi:hypothetical protein